LLAGEIEVQWLPSYGQRKFRLTSLFPSRGSEYELRPVITDPIDESQLITLVGNTTPAALEAANDHGPVADSLVFDHLLLVLKPVPESAARLEKLIDAMHDQHSPEFHRWLTAQQFGERFGLALADRETLERWLESHGFSINRVYQNGLVIDFRGTAAQIRQAFHTEVHNLVLANGEKHIANIRDPQIPAALAPAVVGVASLHDFFPRSHARELGPVSYNSVTNQWLPHFTVTSGSTTIHAVSPYDLATIYNILPLWRRGFTGKGITIATVEVSNLAHPYDWDSFRSSFGLEHFKSGNFKQIYPNCTDPGQNGAELEAALDVEWSSASAPEANIELSACANSRTVSGLDLAILNLLDLEPPEHYLRQLWSVRNYYRPGGSRARESRSANCHRLRHDFLHRPGRYRRRRMLAG
jgi:subtilase family serine protease